MPDIRDIGTIPIAHTTPLPHERPVTNSLAYLLCQTRQRATDYRPGMTPEDVRAVSNRMPDIRDIGTIPIAHTTALPHERPVTNSLAYLLCQTRQRATDYRPGMTPEDVRAVSEKSVRQHETTRGRNAPFDCRRPQAAAPGAVTVPPLTCPPSASQQTAQTPMSVAGLRDTNDTNSMTGDSPLIQRDRIVAAL
jgi:hypothetical protein